VVIGTPRKGCVQYGAAFQGKGLWLIEEARAVSRGGFLT